MKKYKKLAIVALALAAIIIGVIYTVKLIKVVLLNWSTIVDWLSNASITTAVISLGLFLFGCYLLMTANSGYHQRGFARLIKKLIRKTYSCLHDLNVTREKMIIASELLFLISVIIFTANTFPLFIHFNLLKLWLIILGGIGIIGFGVWMFFLTKNHKKIFWPLTLLSFCVLVFTYYLDGFIFSWSHPWITGVVAILITICHLFLGIKSAKKARKEKREKDQYQAECAKKELERLQVRTDAKQALQKRLAQLSFYDLAICYFDEKKDNKYIYWDDIVDMYIEAMTNLIQKSETKLEVSAEQKIHIAWLMSKKQSERSGKFYKLIATVFVATDTEALLFSNVDETTYRAIPEAFAQCTCKKEAIINFLSKKFGNEYKKLLYNRIKREFSTDVFYGLINALIYSYQKTWDEDSSKRILKRIEEIFAFANEKLGSLWSKKNRDALRERMTNIYTFSVLNGVHAYFPAINQDPLTSELTKK